MSLQTISSNRSFGGWHKQYIHDAETVHCAMRFSIYLPPQVENNAIVPVLS